MSGRVGGFFFDGPNRVGVSHLLTWGRKEIQFPKRRIL
jgi:hypothetical protein